MAIEPCDLYTSPKQLRNLNKKLLRNQNEKGQNKKGDSATQVTLGEVMDNGKQEPQNRGQAERR